MTVYDTRSVSIKEVGLFRKKELAFIRKEGDISNQDSAKPKTVDSLYLKHRLFGITISCKPCQYEDLLKYLLDIGVQMISAPDSINVYSGYISYGSYVSWTKNTMLSICEEVGYTIEKYSSSFMSRKDFRIDKFFKVSLLIRFKPEPTVIIVHENFKDSKSRALIEVIASLTPETMEKFADTLWDIVRLSCREDKIRKEYYL